MGADPPVVQAAAVRDRLDVEKALVRVTGRLAVQEKTGNRGPRLRHQVNPAINPRRRRLSPWEDGNARSSLTGGDGLRRSPRWWRSLYAYPSSHYRRRAGRAAVGATAAPARHRVSRSGGPHARIPRKSRARR